MNDTSVLWITLKDGRCLVATRDGGSDIYTYPFEFTVQQTTEGPSIQWRDFIQVGSVRHDDMITEGITIPADMILISDDPIPPVMESYNKLVKDINKRASAIEVVSTMPPALKL